MKLTEKDLEEIGALGTDIEIYAGLLESDEDLDDEKRWSVTDSGELKAVFQQIIDQDLSDKDYEVKVDDAVNLLSRKIKLLINAAIMACDKRYINVASYFNRLIMTSSNQKIRVETYDDDLDEIKELFDRKKFNYQWKMGCSLLIANLQNPSSIPKERIIWALQTKWQDFKNYKSFEKVNEYLLLTTLDSAYGRYKFLGSINDHLMTLEYNNVGSEIVRRLTLSSPPLLIGPDQDSELERMPIDQASSDNITIPPELEKRHSNSKHRYLPIITHSPKKETKKKNTAPIEMIKKGKRPDSISDCANFYLKWLEHPIVCENIKRELSEESENFIVIIKGHLEGKHGDYLKKASVQTLNEMHDKKPEIFRNLQPSETHLARLGNLLTPADEYFMLLEKGECLDDTARWHSSDSQQLTKEIDNLTQITKSLALSMEHLVVRSKQLLNAAIMNCDSRWLMMARYYDDAVTKYNDQNHSNKSPRLFDYPRSNSFIQKANQIFTEGIYENWKHDCWHIIDSLKRQSQLRDTLELVFEKNKVEVADGVREPFSKFESVDDILLILEDSDLLNALKRYNLVVAIIKLIKSHLFVSRSEDTIERLTGAKQSKYHSDNKSVPDAPPKNKHASSKSAQLFKLKEMGGISQGKGKEKEKVKGEKEEPGSSPGLTYKMSND